MQCPQCQHENRDTAKFCESCGSSLAPRCPSCDTEMRPGATFCDQCGTALRTSIPIPSEMQPIAQDGPPSPEFSTPDAERRQLTVMFCDLVGSTRLSGKLDPEDLRDVVRAYQESAASVIQQYEGHIAQYLGDGLLIYFGWPHAHEDDAHRAVHTGLGIVEAVDDLNTILETAHGVQLAVRLGIHTGSVVVGEMGSGDRHENLALGKTPNIAARLEGLAQPGTVVISEDTRRLVAGAFNYDGLGTPELKGVSELLPVFRVLGLSSAASRFEASTTTLTPMVGREVEVDLLMRCWEQVLEGEGQVVLLNGPPGIGKSRLLQALSSRLAQTPHVHLRYQCSPYHINSALYPIATQVTREMKLPLDVSSDGKLERLEMLVAQMGLSVGEALPLFAAMLSIPTDDHYPALALSPQKQKDRTLELFSQGVVNLAQKKPVLFLFEDVHWSDPTSLAALSLVIDQIQDARVLVVLTHRPEFEPPWRNDGHVTTYTLNRLSRRQTAALVEHVTGGKALPADVLDQIVAKTDGIPLFVEELTKHVLESEWLMDSGENYQLTSSRPPLTIPATLQDSLMARLDRLAEVKAVLQLGATIGREFSYTLLRAVSPLSDTELQDALGQLLDAELISQRGQVPETTYIFKHALIQDTVYESLLRSTRQHHHAQIATALESQFDTDVAIQPELIAYHYTESKLTEQAISYWQRASKRSSERSAYMEAVSHANAGLDLLKMLPTSENRIEQELNLQLILAPALMAAKGYADSSVENAYLRARELCEQAGDARRLGRVLAGLSAFYHVRGKEQTAYEVSEQLLSLAQHQQDSVLLLRAYLVMGMSLFHLGEPAAAHRHLEQGIALGDEKNQGRVLRSQDPLAGCYAISAWTFWWLGYPSQALTRTQEAITFAQDLAHPHSLVWALSCALLVFQVCREVGEVQEQADTCITLSREGGFPAWEAASMVLHGWALSLQGHQEEGVEKMHQGIAAWQAGGAKTLVAYFLALLAEVCEKCGQVEEGLHRVNKGLEMVEKTDDKFYAAELHRLKGQLLLQQSPDNSSEAESFFQQALDITRRQEAKSWELRAATSLARLWQSQDKRDEASELLTPIYGWFTEGFDTADLVEAKQLLNELSAEISPPTA